MPSSITARLRRLDPAYSPVAFSLSAEDPQVVEEALAIRPGDHIVCVGAGGETPLSLLSSGARRIDAVDASFPQICLISLKAEVVRRLKLDQVRVVLGVERDSRQALALFSALRPWLPCAVREFWDVHRSMIAAGLLWQGTIQRAMRVGRWGLAFLHGPQGLAELKTLATASEVERFVGRLGGSWRFRLLIRLVINRFTVAAAYPGSGLKNIPPGVTPRQYVMERLTQMLVRRPPARFPQLYALLFEDVRGEDALPPYLRSARFAMVKRRIARLHVIQSDFHEHLRSLPEDGVAGCSLSNLIDWLEDREVAKLLETLVRCARPGARILISSRSRPPEERIALPSEMEVDEALSQRLTEEDRIGYHRFSCLLRVRK